MSEGKGYANLFVVDRGAEHEACLHSGLASLMVDTECRSGAERTIQPRYLCRTNHCYGLVVWFWRKWDKMRIVAIVVVD